MQVTGILSFHQETSSFYKVYSWGLSFLLILPPVVILFFNKIKGISK